MNNWKITSVADLQFPDHFPNDYVGDFVVGDNNAHEWSVILKQGGVAVDLDSYIAMAYVLRPDGNTVPISGTISGNKLIATFTADCYAIDGWCSAVMKIEKTGAEIITVAAIKFRTARKTSDTYVDPSDVLNLREAARLGATAVRYEQQSLSVDQKTVARKNIDAAHASLEKLLSIESQEFSISGNPVRFESLKGIPLYPSLKINPIQSGSGDPYPAGGGKNLLPYPYQHTTKTENGITFTDNGDGSITVNGTATGNAYFNMSVIPELDGVDFSTSTFHTTNGEYVFSMSDVGYGFSAVHTAAEGARVYLRIQSGKTINNVTVYPMVEKGTVPTAWEPYANIRPITGRTSATLTRAGRNVLPNAAQTQTISGVTFTPNADKSITVNGTAADTVFYPLSEAAPCASGAYVLRGTPAGGGNATFALRAMANNARYFDDYGNGQTLTVAPGETIQGYIVIRSGYAASNLRFYPGLYLQSDTQTEYEPYQCDTFTFDFGQTVYGGTLDWNKGEMTIDKGIMTLSGTEVNGTSQVTSTTGETADICVWLSTNKMAYGNYQPGYCSHFHNHGSMRNKNTIRFGASSGGTLTRTIYIYLDSSEFADAAAVNAYAAEQAAAGTPIQIVYPLATPITVQLTKQEIVALAGINTVFSDADEMTVTGRTDIMGVVEYILDKIAAHDLVMERVAALETTLVSNT